MPTSQPTAEQLRSAVELAVRAPSIHNTQPWRWDLRPDGLDLYADRSRQLAVADPDGHNLTISCGGALELARLSLAAQGLQTSVARTPDPADPDLLARMTVTGPAEVTDDLRSRAAAAAQRHSDRRPFAARAVDRELLDWLVETVADDGVSLHVAQHRDERLDLAVLVSQADEAMHSDSRYQEELGSWTRAAPASDGVPATAVPHVTGDEPRHTDLPMRDFEAGITGALPVVGGQDEDPELVVILTTERGTAATLRAGEALCRLLVAAQSAGLAASIISQPVDWPVARERMRGLMSWSDHPQILARIGWPAAGLAAEPTPRRPAAEVLGHPPTSD